MEYLGVLRQRSAAERGTAEITDIPGAVAFLMLANGTTAYASGISQSRLAAVKAIKMTEFKDFEDCLQDRCAERIKAEYIIMRNTDDFEGSAVPAVVPEEFLEIILKS